MGTNVKRERLSIDVLPEERRKIKTIAAMHGTTIKKFVMDCIYQRLQKIEEEKDLQMMMSCPSQELADLWNNESDAIYDED